jgi:hypothetical protein
MQTNAINLLEKHVRAIRETCTRMSKKHQSTIIWISSMNIWRIHSTTWVQLRVISSINENLFAKKRDKTAEEASSNDSKNLNSDNRKKSIDVNDEDVRANNENSSKISITVFQIKIDEDVAKDLNILIDSTKNENLNESIDATIKCVIKCWKNWKNFISWLMK